jgi:cytoskeletal protein RodZ
MSQRDKKRTMTEQLGAWLKGDLRMREERELYRAAREDPFLQEALQGYDRFPEGNHVDAVASIKGKLNKQKRRGLILPIRLAAAAASILILTASVWWLLQPAQGELAIAESTETIEELPQTVEESSSPIMADEEPATEEVPVETKAAQPAIEQKEVASKPQPQKKEVVEPEVAELSIEKEEALEEMALDVSPPSPPPPSPLPGEKISPAPAPVREETIASGQAAAKKKKSDQSDVSLRESTPYAPTAQSRRLQAPSAYNLIEQDQLTQAARPLGGFEALENYLDSAWQQPWKADSMLVEAPFIEVEFQVLKDGSLSDFRILKSVKPEEDSTFIQLLKNGPRWEYLNNELKQPVKVQYRYPQRND